MGRGERRDSSVNSVTKLPAGRPENPDLFPGVDTEFSVHGYKTDSRVHWGSYATDMPASTREQSGQDVELHLNFGYVLITWCWNTRTRLSLFIFVMKTNGWGGIGALIPNLVIWILISHDFCQSPLTVPRLGHAPLPSKFFRFINPAVIECVPKVMVEFENIVCIERNKEHTFNTI